MASGHEYRANRPNTWLHRPMLQSEDSPCQPGAVHTWPLTDMLSRFRDVRFRGRCGHRANLRENSAFDPLQNLTLAGRQSGMLIYRGS